MKKISITVAALAFASIGLSQTVVFDAETPIIPVTGAYGQFTDTDGPYSDVFTGVSSETIDNQFGEVINLGTPGATISGMDFLFLTSQLSSSVDLTAVINIYSTATGATSGSAAEFSGLLSTTTVDFGKGFSSAYAFHSAGQDFDASGNFTGPHDGIALNPAVATGSTVGITVTFLANGASTTDVGLALNEGLVDTVGSNAMSTSGLFYASKASGTHQLAGSSYQNVYNNDMNLNGAMTLYSPPTPSPEPVSMTFMGAGAATIMAKVRRKKSK